MPNAVVGNMMWMKLEPRVQVLPSILIFRTDGLPLFPASVADIQNFIVEEPQVEPVMYLTFLQINR